LIREKVKEKGKHIEGTLCLSEFKQYVIVFDINILHFLNVFPDFCLACGSTQIEVRHPLFEGGLCLKCKVIL